LNLYGIDSWKWYCHTDPAQTGAGFQVDDDNAMWFYEESRKREMQLVSIHKGNSYQSRTLGHLANPKDVEKAALKNPDFNFIIYHSAIKHGVTEPDYKKNMEYDPATGDFLWHKILMDIKLRNPNMTNVYCEVGSFFAPRTFSAFGHDCYVCHGAVDLNHTGDTRLMLLSKKRRDGPEVVASICAQCHLRGGKSKSTGLPYPNQFVAGD